MEDQRRAEHATGEILVSRSTLVLVGVASLLLLTWMTVALRHEAIENDLAQRVEQALAAHAITGLNIVADGRDLALGGEISSKVEPDYVTAVVNEVWGVRTVDVGGLIQSSSSYSPGDPLYPRLDQGRIAQLGGDLSNPLDAGTCQRMMARLAANSSLRFARDAASPTVESYPLLNDLAAVAYQCPQTRLIIGAHTDAVDQQDGRLRLSQARAEAIERFFNLAGIPAERMQVVAYGDSQPVASNASETGRAANRRITFDVLPLE